MKSKLLWALLALLVDAARRGTISEGSARLPVPVPA